MDTKESGVYIIKCKHSGYAYIGGATNLRLRKNTHIKMLRRNQSHNKVLQFAWNMFGEANFSFEILELCGPSILEERELYYLNNFQGSLFNILKDSRFPGKFAKAGERRSERARKQHLEKNFGAVSWTEEGRERIRQSASRIHKGKILSPETVAKLKATLAANPWSEERRTAQRERLAAQRASGPVMCSIWTPERRAAQAERARAQGFGKNHD